MASDSTIAAARRNKFVKEKGRGTTVQIVPCGKAARDPARSHDECGYELMLICRSCGTRWRVEPQADGRFFPGFWVCPRRCDW